MENIEPAAEVAIVVELLTAARRSLEMPAHSAVIRVDRLRTRQIIPNLISNGERHGGKSKTVVGRHRSAHNRQRPAWACPSRNRLQNEWGAAWPTA